MEYRINKKTNTITFATSGGKIMLPLDLKVKVLRKLRQAQRNDDDFDDLDFFYLILENAGDENTLAAFDECGNIEAGKIVETYFEQWQKLAAPEGVDAGE